MASLNSEGNGGHPSKTANGQKSRNEAGSLPLQSDGQVKVERSNVQAVDVPRKGSSANQYRMPIPQAFPRSKSGGESSTSVPTMQSQSKLPFAPVLQSSANQEVLVPSTKIPLDDHPMAFFLGSNSSSSPSTLTLSRHDFSSSPTIKRAPGPVIGPVPKRQKQFAASTLQQGARSGAPAARQTSDKLKPFRSAAASTSIASVAPSPSKCFILHLRFPLTLYISGDVSNLPTNAIP